MLLHDVYGLSETHSPGCIATDVAVRERPGSVGRTTDASTPSRPATLLVTVQARQSLATRCARCSPAAPRSWRWTSTRRGPGAPSELGVAQAGLEATARYLARELGPDGVRVNVVATGPHRTLLMRAVDGHDQLIDRCSRDAPLGRDPKDSTAVAKAAVTLLSDWLPATTGEVLHADGGMHLVG